MKSQTNLSLRYILITLLTTTNHNTMRFLLANQNVPSPSRALSRTRHRSSQHHWFTSNLHCPLWNISASFTDIPYPNYGILLIHTVVLSWFSPIIIPWIVNRAIIPCGSVIQLMVCLPWNRGTHNLVTLLSTCPVSMSQLNEYLLFLLTLPSGFFSRSIFLVCKFDWVIYVPIYNVF